MEKSIRRILMAQDWAHHHTALVLTGIFLSGFMAFWQLFVPQMQTHAAGFDCMTATSIGVPASECQALSDLYANTNGPSWYTNTNWNVDTNICTGWYGIGCGNVDGSGFQHVTTINLPNQNLNGTVPSSIQNLSYISDINLSNNNSLTFHLEDVANLTGIVSLNLENAIVMGNFNSLSNLTNINLLAISCRSTQGQCEVYGSLDAVSNMSSLTYFGVDGLGLTGTLDPLYDKLLLNHIDVDGNSLSGGIDPAIGNLTGLLQIEMSNDGLTGPIPAEINNLVNATELSINNNHLDGTIPSLTGMISLIYLNIGDNDFDGSFLQDLSPLTQLQTFQADYNTGLIMDISSFAGLGSSFQTIILNDTILTGSISSLSNLTELLQIHMSCRQVSDCYLDGTLQDLSNLTALDQIHFYKVHLGGTLDGVYDLTHLTVLDVAGNELSGTVSEDISHLSSLQKLLIDGNSLSGLLPAGLETLTGLQQLYLSDNRFTGPLPTLSGFTQLQQLSVGNDPWVGTLPDSWGELTGLKIFKLGGTSLHDTGLSGTLPSSWGNWTNLQEFESFFLPGISGTIPTSWGNWTHLTSFQMIYTNIYGTIPDSFQNFLTTNTMDKFVINNNHLEGDIPSWFTQINIANKAKIEANCLNTTVSSGVQSVLDTYFGLWNSQSNCLSDLQVTYSIAQSGHIVPGDIIDYYITYQNNGPQRAPNLILSQSFDGLSIVDTNPVATSGIAYANYFTGGDQCFTDMMHDGTGPYSNYFASMFIGYNPQDYTGTDYTLTDVANIMFGGNGDVGGGVDPDIIRYVVDDPTLGSGGAITTLLCMFLQGFTDITPAQLPAIQNFYKNIGANCFGPLFGINARDIATPACGANQIPGYIWNIGNVPVNGSGTIHVRIQIPSNTSSGATFTTQTFLDTNGENKNGGFLDLVVAQASDTSTHHSGGGGGFYTDTQKGICELRDCSDSSYDQTCGVCPVSQDTGTTTSGDAKSLLPDGAVVQNYLASISDSMHATAEQIAAFLFGKAAGLTTATSYELFRPIDGITRGEFAKFIDGFVENVLGRKPDASRLRMCSQYTDVNSSLGDLQLAIYKACMHKVMGLQNDGATPLSTFNPSVVLTRKDVVTTIDRIINGNKNDNADPYYTKHMAAMYAAGLISVTEPDMVEQRINALMMFKRIVDKMDVLFK